MITDSETHRRVDEEMSERRSINEETPEVSFFELFRFAQKTQKVFMLIGIITSICMGAFFPIFAFISGNLIDSFGSDEIASESAQAFFKGLVLGGIALVTGFAMFTSWTILGERQAVRCRKQYFKSILKQQVGWFDQQEQEQISSKFQIDCQTYQAALGEKMSTLIMIISMLLVGIGLSLLVGWILTLIILAYIPLVICGWTYFISTKVSVGQEQDRIYQQSDSKAQEFIGAIKVVKQMNAQEFQSQNQNQLLKKVKEVYTSTLAQLMGAIFFSILAFNLIFPLSYWYGSQCVFDTNLCPQSISTLPYTAGTVLQILYSLLLPAISLNQLAPCIEKIAEGKSAAKRIFAVIDREPLVRSKEGALVPPSFRGELEFRDVSFAYPKSRERKVLSGMSLRVDCRHSAIVGPSGGGKSTIFQLIMRFYDPDEGSIILDGTDLRDLDLRWLRAQLGYVTQEPTLFAASIRENLLLGKPGASEEELEAALAKAEALQFVSGLRDGLETHVGSGGGQLSGGQKQRVAIARALVKGPRVLLMDEATSALDRTNEREILSTLMQLSRDFISISITHRNRVLAGCDKVFRFQNGKIKTFPAQDNISGKQILFLDKQSLLLKRNSSLFEESSNKNMIDEFIISEEKELNLSKQTSLSLEEKIKFHKKPSELQKLEDQKQNKEIVQKKQEQNMDATLSRIFPYLLKHKSYLFSGSLLSIINGVTFPSFGIFFAKIIAAELKFQLKGNEPELKNDIQIYSLVTLGLAIVGTVGAVLSFFFFSRVAIESVQQIRKETIKKVLDMPIAWFERPNNSPEKIISTISISCKALYSFQKLFINYFLMISTSIIFSLVGAIIFEWRTGSTTIALLPLILLSQFIQFGFVQGLSASKNQIYSNSTQILKESVMNIRTVLSLGGPEVMSHRYEKELDEVDSTITGKTLLSGFMFGISAFLQFSVFALILYLGTVYIRQFNLDINGPLQAIFLVTFACMTAGNKSSMLPDVSNARIAAKNIFTLIDLEDEHQVRVNSGSKLLKEPLKGDIKFIDVDFQYPTRQSMTLNKLNLQIREGQNIGIVGESGGGKSSIINLLQGFYTPTNGTILLDDINIKDFDLHHLRSCFGTVSQEPILFNQTIQYNIRYNIDNISEQDIIAVANSVNFNPNLQLFSHSPTQNSASSEPDQNNLLTEFQRNVGPKGSHMSGGQKQRIAMARTLLRSPKIFLFDEVTSALDPENERKVQQTLERIIRGKTTINITHKLERVDQLDKIVVIDKGRVEEEGTYSQLVEDPESRFNYLLHGIYRY